LVFVQLRILAATYSLLDSCFSYTPDVNDYVYLMRTTFSNYQTGVGVITSTGLTHGNLS